MKRSCFDSSGVQPHAGRCSSSVPLALPLMAFSMAAMRLAKSVISAASLTLTTMEETPPEEVQCWLVRSDDGFVVSRYSLRASEQSGGMFAFEAEEFPLETPPGCIMVCGREEDVVRFMLLKTS